MSGRKVHGSGALIPRIEGGGLVKNNQTVISRVGKPHAVLNAS